MISRTEHDRFRDTAWRMLKASGIALRDHEISQIEVADFGLSRLGEVGAGIMTFEANDWVSVKVLVLTPWQLEPQHRHPPSLDGTYPGKTEVLRCQWGRLLHYHEGPPSPHPQARPAASDRPHLTVWHETVLDAGEQLVLKPNTWHWFQAGPEGAVVWTISSKVTDSADQWQDPRIVRKTVITD